MWATVTVQRRGSELCDEAWVYEMADRSPAPAASLLYEGATHFHGRSPAAVVGPYIRTEIADWVDGVPTDSAPGVDVWAHVHGNGEEMFYVIDGELDHLMTMGR